jgi:hypothetical protein
MSKPLEWSTFECHLLSVCVSCGGGYKGDDCGKRVSGAALGHRIHPVVGTGLHQAEHTHRHMELAGV